MVPTRALEDAKTHIYGTRSYNSIQVDLEQLVPGLYLDTTLIPEDFEQEVLIRIFEFLSEHVIPDKRSPYPTCVGEIPVIVRYTSSGDEGTFPQTTEGYAGLCDVVYVSIPDTATRSYHIITQQVEAYQQAMFLVVIAIPDREDPNYEVELWGFTAHEIAHALGAIDGPRSPFYKQGPSLAPIAPESDTYYWFGIVHFFSPDYQGIIWNAWQDICHTILCKALRHDVFGYEK